MKNGKYPTPGIQHPMPNTVAMDIREFSNGNQENRKFDLEAG